MPVRHVSRFPYPNTMLPPSRILVSGAELSMPEHLCCSDSLCRSHALTGQYQDRLSMSKPSQAKVRSGDQGRGGWCRAGGEGSSAILGGAGAALRQSTGGSWGPRGDPACTRGGPGGTRCSVHREAGDRWLLQLRCQDRAHL